MSDFVSQLGLVSLVRTVPTPSVSEVGVISLTRRVVTPANSQLGLMSLARRSVRHLTSQVGVVSLVRLYKQGDANQVVVIYDVGYHVEAQTLSLQLAWAGPMTMSLEHSDDQSVWDVYDTGISTITKEDYGQGPLWDFDVHAAPTRFWRMTATSFVDRTAYQYPAMTVLSMRIVDPFGEPLSVYDPLDHTRTNSVDTVVSSQDDVILCDCVTPLSVTLPRASGVRRLLTIYKIDSANNDVSLLTWGTDTSEVVSLTLDAPFVRLINDTTSGWIVA